MTRRELAFSASLLVLVALARAAPASAQVKSGAIAESGPSASLEELVVTARRKEENVQRTPVAVTALTSESLERSQIDTVQGLQRSVPNLTISSNSTSGATATYFAIRGQANLGATGANDPAVGLYVDDVYIARTAGSLVDLIDVKRAEVLRGPQGTLFGRNTTGGAINIVTNQPVDRFEGSLQARVGDYDLREITGIVNLPLIADRLALRMVAQYSDRSGYNKNLFLGRDYGDRRNLFLKPSLKYTSPSGKFDFTLRADHTHYKDHGQPYVLVAYDPANTFLKSFFSLYGGPRNDVNLDRYLQGAVGYRNNYSNEDQSSNVKISGVSGVANADLGWADFKSITAYRDVTSKGRNDTDASPYRLLATDYGIEQRQFSQEFQLSGSSGALGWIVGAYYFQEHGREFTRSVNYITTVLTGSERRSFNDAYANNKSYAAFGQVYYDLTDRIKLTAGLRQTRDRREVIRMNYATLDPAPVCAVSLVDRDDGVSCKQTLRKEFDYLSYLFSVDYQATDNVFLYAKTSRAFLAGGFNTRTTLNSAFSPEEARDIEAGVKAEWFDHRLRTNLAVFYAKQSNLQRVAQSINPQTGQPVNFLQNAGKAHVQGVEFEASATPWRGMEVRAAFGYLDAAYDEFADVLNIGTVTAPIIVAVDRTNEQPLQAPKITWSVEGSQRIPVSLGDVVLHADFAYVDDQTFFTNASSPAASPAVKAAVDATNRLGVVKAHGLLNAQASLELASAPVTLSLWARNLTGKDFYNRAYPDIYPSLGWAVAFTAPPRTYGVTATYKF